MTPAERVVEALDRIGCKPKRTGSGYESRCPAHNDKNPSLSVGAGDDGRALVNCHAGCDHVAILDALGMGAPDLFPSDGEVPTVRKETEGPAFVSPVPKDAPRSPSEHPKMGTPSNRWNYFDEKGRPVYAVLRFDTPGGKEIRPLSLWRNTSGSLFWKWAAAPFPRALYGLPSLASNIGGAVLIAEGEKSVDAAKSLFADLVVVTSSGGSSAAEKTDWTPLKGRSILVWPDQDEAGRKYAADVRRLALEAGAKSVAVVDVPDTWPAGWDLADDLPEGVTAEDLSAMIEGAVPEGARSVASAWTQDPEPLQREIPKPAEYPVDALGEVLGGVVFDICGVIQAPAATVAQSVLAAASLATQAHADVEMDGRRTPLSIFFVSILESGGRKSAADKVALSAHSKHEHDLVDSYKAEIEVYSAEYAAWKKCRENALKGKTREGISKALLDVGSEPEAPAHPQLTTGEPTLEGLIKLLVIGQASLGIFSDEGGQLLGGFAMSSENRLKTFAGFSSLWDGGRITRTRSTDGSVVLFGRRVALHLMVQPMVAEILLGDPMAANQGFLPRCLISWPVSTLGDQHYVEEDVRQRAGFRRWYGRMMSLLEMEPAYAENDIRELNPRTIVLEPDAKAIWIKFHDWVQAQVGNKGAFERIRGFAAKAAEHVLRIAGVLAVVDDPHTKTVSLGNVEAGIVLVRYYLEESMRLLGLAEVDANLSTAERLLEWMENRGPYVAVSDIYQRGPNQVRSKEVAEKMLSILEGHGRARPVSGSVVIDGINRKNVWEVRNANSRPRL